jgi:hypothetical protein
MQPTPESAPTGTTSPVVGESFVEFVCADRQRAAYILLGISVLLLALCGWAVYSASKKPTEAEKKADKEKADSPFPEPTEESEVKAKNPNRNEYITAALLAGLGVLTTVCAGGWLLVSIPPMNHAQQKTQARAVILAAGGLLGAILILGSGAFFYLWGNSFNDWLDKGQLKQAKFVLGPFLAFAVGGLVMFLAIQPARAEERDNRTLRQLIYGANLGLSVLLVFVTLLVVNVFISPRLPNRLDVTGGGFYTLSDGSKEVLGRLPEPMTAYVIMSSGRREADDIRRLLQNCQDASNGKLTVKFINPVADAAEYRRLAERAPKVKTHEVEGATAGVYLTVGEDEKRNSFIRSDEFIKRESGPNRESGPQTFIGEARLMKELLFLSESEEKAVIYFTQSAGELDISEGGREERRPTATARQLREYLTRNNLEAKPLKFDLKDPKVPDDAAVVIVAEPKRELDPAHVAAITKYMTEPRPGSPPKKGKLIVLAGAAFGPKKEVLRTGLEGLLMEFQVRLDPRVVVGQFTNRDTEPYAINAAFSVESLRARNPVAMALGEKATFPSLLWRQVRPAQMQKGAGAYRTVSLLFTADPDRYTWMEDHLYTGEKEFGAAWSEVVRNQGVATAKELTDEPRPVAVAVSESVGDTGRVVVVGNGLLVSDFYAMQAGGEPPGFDLISGSVDWLRERPTLNIQVNPKTYTEFKFPSTTDENRGVFLPLLLSVTIIGGLGICMWLVRRTA